MQCLKKLSKIDFNYSLSVLNDIENIQPIDIDIMLSKMPDQWMAKSDKQGIVKWWQSAAFIQRIDRLKKEINSHVMV
jgi:hypothetical protein